MPKLFGELRERYAERPGGYTRVLRTEPRDTYSQAPSAILELVDGPKDMRFAMTAATIARDRKFGRNHSDITRMNIQKVTQFREGGMAALEEMVGLLKRTKVSDEEIKAAEGKEVEEEDWEDVEEEEEGDEFGEVEKASLREKTANDQWKNRQWPTRSEHRDTGKWRKKQGRRR
jgi:hypothetical protein